MSKSDKNSTCDLRSFSLISLLNQFNACVASDNDSSKKAVIGWMVIAGFYALIFFFFL